MFINKINGGSGLNNKTFKGYEYVKDDYGKTIHNFYYPFDGKEREATLEFYKVKEAPELYHGYKIIPEAGVKRFNLDRETLTAKIDVDKIFDLAPDEQLAYRVCVQYEEPKADTGMQFDAKTIENNNEVWKTYTLLPKAVTKPMGKNGLSCITIIDTHKPGAQYYGYDSDRTGEIEYNENLQKEKEQIKRGFANKVGGTLAGVEHDIPNLRKRGITNIVMTPLAGYDTLYYHRYHNKNNFQIADEIGNIDNFGSFARNLFKHGMTYVFDATYTSEGSEGINVQYALKWAHQHPDALYRFRLNGIDDGPVGFGFVPKNKENLRYKLINSPYILDKKDTGKVVVKENIEYDRHKPTYIQAYDATMVTEEQANSKEIITGYGAPVSGSADKLAVDTYQDSVVSQKNQIYDLENFRITLENARDFINSSEKPIEINSPEVTLLIAQTPTFEFSQKNKNISLWEDKFGLVARNHGISANDEKVLMSILSEAEREDVRKKIEKGGIQNIDLDVQTTNYWARIYKENLTYYITQTLQGAKTVEEIDELIKEGKLPEQVRLSAEALENIKNGFYQLEPKGELERDEATVKALMKLPLGTLEFAENTVSVISQSYFSNLAPTKELIGKTRYELEQMGNPHLTDNDASTYLKINKIFNNDIKNFADAIIEKINAQSEEKLIDEYGEYTEYGEYVIEHIGQYIAKYAFLKSLTGDNFIGNYVKSMPNGDIAYNYVAIREKTNLEDLDINESTMESEAIALQRAIQKGINKLNNNDVDFLASAFSKQLKNTTLIDFRVSEAMYDKSSLGLNFRIDALKDVKDIDAVKELAQTFGDFWDEINEYYQYITAAITEHNSCSIIIAEITDMDATIKKSWGKADLNDFESMKNAGAKYPNELIAMRDFYIKSGVNTEANYSDFFTSVFRVQAQDFEDGVSKGDIGAFFHNFRQMATHRGVDFMRNLFTFNGNHDKPRVVHFSALDMSLYHKNLVLPENRYAREKSMELLFGVDDLSKLPLEIKLNINNADYFRTVSSEAISMCNSLKKGVNVAVDKNIIKKEEREYFIKALADLADGKYLNYGIKFDRKSIKVEELQHIQNVITEIIDNAQQNYGLNINDKTKTEWIEWVKGYATNENLGKYSVQADKNDIISERIDWIYEGQKNSAKRRADNEYSAYVASLLAFTKEAFKSACGDDVTAMKAFGNAAIDFLNKYDQSFINENSTEFPYSETHQNAERKNGFANSEFEETVLMLIEQAEYIAGKKFENKDEIMLEIYKAIHEPAMKKSIAMAAMIAAVVGMPAEYFNDSIGQSGGEWKNNNVYNQNRNPIQRLKYMMLEDYRKEMQKLYDATRNVRTVKGAEALNIGTPYMLNTFKNNIGAWLMQSADSMTITIMTDEGVDKNFGGVRNENYSTSLQEIVFPEGLLISKGTEFECITANNTVKAFIEHFQYNGVGKYFARLVGENGAPIVVNSQTSREGVSIFKRVTKNATRNLASNAARIAMHGRKYNVTSPMYNAYNVQPQDIEGQKLSILSK